MNPFLDLQDVPVTLAQGKVGGSAYLDNARSMQIGAGNTGYRVVAGKGIWLGAKSFEDAPFSVDMQGNIYGASATFPSLVTIRVFKQDAIPTSLHVGDLWFDTDDNNKIYRAAAAGAATIASGQWELLNDLRAADAITKAGSAQTLTGDIVVGSGGVKIDGANIRILINDGTTNRGVFGNV